MPSVHCQVGNCDVFCEGGCACIADSQTHECLGCICNVGHPHLLANPTLARSDDAYATPLQVDVHAQTLSMAQLAKLLEAVFPGRIAIPASAVNSEVSVELKNTSLEEMARSLDLLVLPAESAASAGLEAE